MRSRSVVTLLLVVLSLQLALVPFAGVLGPVSRTMVDTGSSVAAKDARDKPATKSRKAQANKTKGTKQRRAQRNRNAKASQAKKRGHLTAPRRLRDTSPRGPAPVTELPTGVIERGEQEAARAQDRAGEPGDRYIVLLKNERADSRVQMTALETQTPGVIPTAVFEHVVKGFAAYLTPEAREALEQDPRVASVTPDRERFLASQTVPRGISRTGVQTNPEARLDGQDQRVDVDIAIIDTGVDLGHPDLNVIAFADCTPSPAEPGWDQNGHGTHVAGTAAALDNNIGVVGVAPGARIWAFRVEDDNGKMFDSYIITCMDAVAQFATVPPFNVDQTIDVANMSLGAESTESRCGVGDPFNDAVCAMVAAGVTTVVAAGNDAMDAANFNPANMDEVITVSALADSDGARLGLAGTYADRCTNPQQDDSLATFSNFGPKVDIAAPGVGVLSTWPRYLFQPCVLTSGIGYDVLPGTSMASPHVAGAAALLLAQNPGLTPEQVRAALLASRERVALPGDPDGINEGVLYVGAADNKGPSVKVAGRVKARVRKPVPIRVVANDPSGVARVILYRCTKRCRVVRQDAGAPFLFVRKTKRPGRVRYKARVYDNVGNYTEAVKVITIKPKKAKNPKKSKNPKNQKGPNKRR